jgi:uncharacterized protein YllA (UPF0747 family)
MEFNDVYYKIITILLGTIVSLLLYIFKNNIVNKLDTIEKSTNDKIDNFEKTLTKRIDSLDIDFHKKIEKFEEEIRRHQLHLDQKFEKNDIEMRMMNKEIIILQNEYKHLNRRLNKVEGIDSTEY